MPTAAVYNNRSFACEFPAMMMIINHRDFFPFQFFMLEMLNDKNVFLLCDRFEGEKVH